MTSPESVCVRGNVIHGKSTGPVLLWSLSTSCFGHLLSVIFFVLFLINVISVNTVKVIIFVSSAKQ